MKGENFKVVHTEDSDIVFYAVKSQDGRWFRSKGYMGSGNSWVTDIMKAKFYTNPGPAKSQVTFWSKNYPEMGIPFLVRISLGKIEYIEQQDRVVKALEKQVKKEQQAQIVRIEREIERAKQKILRDHSNENYYAKQIEKLEKTIVKLKK